MKAEMGREDKSSMKSCSPTPGSKRKTAKLMKREYVRTTITKSYNQAFDSTNSAQVSPEDQTQRIKLEISEEKNDDDERATVNRQDSNESKEVTTIPHRGFNVRRSKKVDDKESRWENVLCFGDSLTWGMGHEFTARYEVTWPRLIADRLRSYRLKLVEAGLCSRTTCLNDPNNSKWMPGAEDHFFNGLNHFLPEFMSATPRWLILLLGTNDLKTNMRREAKFRTMNASVIANNCAKIALKARKVHNGSPFCKGKLHIVIIAPPLVRVCPLMRDMGYDQTSVTISQDFANAYSRMCKKHGFMFVQPKIDMSRSKDGIHIPESANKIIAEEVWKVMQKELVQKGIPSSSSRSQAKSLGDMEETDESKYRPNFPAMTSSTFASSESDNSHSNSTETEKARQSMDTFNDRDSERSEAGNERKAVINTHNWSASTSSNSSTNGTRKRGRPPKRPSNSPKNLSDEGKFKETETQIKRNSGRPTKRKFIHTQRLAESSKPTLLDAPKSHQITGTENMIKRIRGRPRKHTCSEQLASAAEPCNQNQESDIRRNMPKRKARQSVANYSETHIDSEGRLLDGDGRIIDETEPENQNENENSRNEDLYPAIDQNEQIATNPESTGELKIGKATNEPSSTLNLGASSDGDDSLNSRVRIERVAISFLSLLMNAYPDEYPKLVQTFCTLPGKPAVEVENTILRLQEMFQGNKHINLAFQNLVAGDNGCNTFGGFGNTDDHEGKTGSGSNV